MAMWTRTVNKLLQPSSNLIFINTWCWYRLRPLISYLVTLCTVLESHLRTRYAELPSFLRCCDCSANYDMLPLFDPLPLCSVIWRYWLFLFLGQDASVIGEKVRCYCLPCDLSDISLRYQIMSSYKNHSLLSKTLISMKNNNVWWLHFLPLS